LELKGYSGKFNSALLDNSTISPLSSF